ncbi:MAG TPA: metal-sensing transcriptional repressor [Candidatus Alectryocaccomicrobium excrementavium]|uniref:Metal-sensing transcriptional repressor n=1 Tax=Candidatus Alectryocaccomicrobium excrementavium TaxID=2840668 RepID=A0A9D1K8I9_9FIRM|nr:metal-sensing transcriptional repressor [Candidatus Alectryocaccomicrobium excrementavium]
MKADPEAITRQLKIARGQLDGILRMVEEDRYCVDISNQILATQALLRRINKQILEAHIRNCVREGLHSDDPNPKLEEALSLLEKMMT